MISRIEGELISAENKIAIINASGIGFKVFTTVENIEKLKENKNSKVFLWTHMAVRENSMDLYGFTTREELSFFELLITVSGIGPKTALSILNITSVSMLKRAISSGDTSHLTKVSGIGKKNAEKIVLELKDKLGIFEEISERHLQSESDAMEALTSLGYSQKEVRDALKKVPKNISETGEKVRHALKNLNSKK